MPRLGIDSWAAYKQVPRRGLEIGGILLGRTEVVDNCVHLWIDAYRIVESEHRSGPSYLPSDNDFERLQEEVLSSGGAAMGLFRTHTRSEQMGLELPDSEMLARCFDGGAALLMLLGPAAGKAAIFARVHGDLQCVFECALASSISSMLTLRQERPPRQTEPQAPSEPRQELERRIAAAPPEPPPVERMLVPQQHPAPPPLPLPAARLPRWAGANRTWVMPAAIALLACAAIADSVSRSLHHNAVEPSLLRLNVEHVGPSLRLSWDPQAAALQGGRYAVLRVEDGDQISERALGLPALKSGAARYEPHTSNVTFRLDIYKAEPSSTGAIQVVSPEGVPPIQAGHPAAGPPLAEERIVVDNSVPAPAAVSGASPAKPAVAPGAGLRGLSIAPLSPAQRGRHHLAASATGVVVTGVKPGSAAFETVLEEGDVIQEVNRQPISGVADFQQAMHDAEGEVVLLSVRRDGVLRFHALP